MGEYKRGVAICHYNRFDNIKTVIEAVKDTTPADTKIVICDDGSDFTQWQEAVKLDDEKVLEIGARVTLEDFIPQNFITIRGPNLGVAANKNRALWALQDCHYLCILEDDLYPTEKGWFEQYEQASQLSGIHHFCRVQDKEVLETVDAFGSFMQANGLTPIYGPSPRGDLTFCTRRVVERVGAFNPRFRGAGYAHGEWSKRCARGGLINHPNKWVDIKEARDKFVQVGDTSGGRWEENQKGIKRQLARNKTVLKELEKEDYIYHRLVLE
jgi:glycosyltransferase involved in cell wall biosynthesis